MRLFKQLFRSAAFIGFVGGWAAAASTVYVVVRPNTRIPAFVTKDHPSLGKDTLMDTRNWSLRDDAAHPEFVRRVIQVGKSNLLAHTVSTTSVPVSAQLEAAIAVPALAAKQ